MEVAGGLPGLEEGGDSGRWFKYYGPEFTYVNNFFLTVSTDYTD